MSNPPTPAAMKSAEPKNLTPKLRFPEFREAGAWETKKLGDITSITTERVGNMQCIPMSITSGVGLVSQQEKFGRTIAGSQYKNYLRLEKGDFAYNKSATKEFPQGYIAMYSGDAIAAVPNSIFTCFRVIENSSCAKYLDYLFQSNLHGKWLRKYITVGARAHGSLNIEDNDILSIPIPSPTGKLLFHEQQKIADCLISLDELIAAESQQLDALKAHKKGLMQQLFPREGKTTPQRRFSAFKNAEEWRYSTLGEIAQFSSGGTPSKEMPEYWNGTIPWISASSMYDTIINDSALKITTFAVEKGARIAKKGALLILIRGSMLFNRVPMGLTEIDVAFNQDVKALEIDSGIDKLFLLYQLSTFEKRIPINETGIGAGKIEMDDLKKFTIFLPSISEQQKIAKFLFSIENQITKKNQKVKSLQDHKKGLMQQLFPSREEA